MKFHILAEYLLIIHSGFIFIWILLKHDTYNNKTSAEKPFFITCLITLSKKYLYQKSNRPHNSLKVHINYALKCLLRN